MGQKTMKIILAGTIAVLGFVAAGSAMASDLPIKAPVYKEPVEAPYSWTGWYTGIHGGYAWGGSATATVTPAGIFPPGAFIITAATAPFTLSTEPKGWLAGVQLGYNYQFDRNWVAGVEVDFSFAGIKDTDSGPYGGSYRLQNISVVNGVATLSEKLDYFGTLRGRIGFLPSPQVLAYLTGGLAWGHIKLSLSDSFTTTTTPPGTSVTTSATATSSDTRFGYALGGGIEWALVNDWTLRGEYLYLHLDNNVRLVAGNAVATSSGLTAHIARAALNYRFAH
jgi:outer membrane immunogenic protein